MSNFKKGDRVRLIKHNNKYFGTENTCGLHIGDIGIVDSSFRYFWAGHSYTIVKFVHYLDTMHWNIPIDCLELVTPIEEFEGEIEFRI